MLSGAQVQTLSQENSISSRDTIGINKSGLIEQPVPLINSARSKTNQTDGTKSGRKRSRKTLSPPAVIEGSPVPQRRAVGPSENKYVASELPN